MTPLSFFSPSSFLSNLPMLAVAVRVVASVRSMSCLRSSRSVLLAPCARARFPSFCLSFLATRALRASRASFDGSKSAAVYHNIRCTISQCYDPTQDTTTVDAKKKTWRRKRRTSISRDLNSPLRLKLLILSFPSPPINPLLLLLVPLLPVPPALIIPNPLRTRELFPFGGWFRFREGF